MNSLMLLLVICVAGLVRFTPCHGQNSQQDFLNGHNVARNAVGVSNITWSATLASYAQNYVASRQSDCSLVHSNGPYGENLAKGSGSFSALTVVNLWVAEKSNYDYYSNSCINGGQCLHYTQVVWRNSINIGCARLQCNNGWWFVSCNYNPPGNYVGQSPY